MKKYIYLSLATLSTLFSAGCMDDYLNEPSPSDQGTLSTESTYSNETNATAVIAGLLRQQRSAWSEYYSPDAGGLYSMLFARTVKGSDVQLSDSWYVLDYQNNNREPTDSRTGFSWRFPYMMIGRANLFIKGVEESTGIGDSRKPELLAQAKALRGFYYFQLALEFNNAYKYNTQAPAPPVYTSIDLEGKPMGTLEELYNQIIADLKYSVENVSIARIDNSWVNKQVAAGMLANVYLSMENWSGAEEMAKIAYGNDVIGALNTINSYQPIGFKDESDKEWLWSMTQTTNQTISFYTAPHSYMDINDGVFKNGFINTKFASLFKDEDRRKEALSIYSSDENNIKRIETTKFKYTSSSSMPIYRTPEFILVAAESAVRQGKESEAQDILNKFKSTRYKDFQNESLTGTDLIDEILLERRKEFYGENGIQWFDAKRLQKGIKRTGNHAVKVNLEPNDKRFILKIPQIEIDNNPNIDATVNIGR